MFVSVIALLLFRGTVAFADEAEPLRPQATEFSGGVNVYSFFVNVVREPFSFPLIGFVNIMAGSHNGLQAGFVNVNTGDFGGLQLGFVNTALGNLQGSQVGFVNIAGGSFQGAQIGFVNTAVGGKGPQVGFVNVSPGPLTGVQIGFVNFVDSIEGGIPVGFISIVRNGGFKAVEYAMSDFHLLGIGLKLGVESFYGIIYVGYDPTGDDFRRDFVTGFGFGSLIPLGRTFFLNPELLSANGFASGNGPYLTSFATLLGLNLGRNLAFVAGPSLSWQRTEAGKGVKPLLGGTIARIDDRNSLSVGARLGFRVRI